MTDCHYFLYEIFLPANTIQTTLHIKNNTLELQQTKLCKLTLDGKGKINFNTI